ncbi:MAG: hypothetical protein JXD21_04825 [Candidatus Omnitrophica bacterium]|nr:hypothetical protein [Candidatus Omnitrophota bacterium]
MDKFDLDKTIILFIHHHHTQNEQGLNVKDIAQGIDISWKNVADSLLDLQEKGFLQLNKFDENHPVPEERGLYVTLTEEGLKLAQRLASES